MLYSQIYQQLPVVPGPSGQISKFQLWWRGDGKLCQHLCDLQTLYITKFQKKVDAPKRSEKEKETGKKLKSSQEEKEKSTKEKQNVVMKSSNDNATAASNVVEEISAQPSTMVCFYQNLSSFVTLSMFYKQRF